MPHQRVCGAFFASFAVKQVVVFTRSCPVGVEQKNECQIPIPRRRIKDTPCAHVLDAPVRGASTNYVALEVNRSVPVPFVLPTRTGCPRKASWASSWSAQGGLGGEALMGGA